MKDIDAAFDDAYRTYRIEAGDDPATLPNPYARPTAGQDNATKPQPSGDTGGGFIVDDDEEPAGGGFIVDDDAEPSGGGFIVDDDDDDVGGGFMASEIDLPSSSTSAPSVTKLSTIPLSAIPEALSNLGLDASDASVLALFAETAYTPSSPRRRLPPSEKPEKVVGRTEFQQVASVLLEQMQEQEDEEEESGRRRPKRRAAVKGRKKAAEIMDDAEDGGGGGGFIVDSDVDDSEDDFGAGKGGGATLDTGSDLSDGYDDGEEDYASRSASTRRRRRGAGAPRSPSPASSLSSSTPRKKRKSQPSSAPRTLTHLNPLQRDQASSLFSLLLAHLPPSTLPTSQRRIGTDALAAIIASIGDSFPRKEIDEMIEEASKLFAPASEGAEERKSAQAIRGAAAAQGIDGASVGLDEFAGVLVHNRLL